MGMGPIPIWIELQRFIQVHIYMCVYTYTFTGYMNTKFSLMPNWINPSKGLLYTQLPTILHLSNTAGMHSPPRCDLIRSFFATKLRPMKDSVRLVIWLIRQWGKMVILANKNWKHDSNIMINHSILGHSIFKHPNFWALNRPSWRTNNYRPSSCSIFGLLLRAEKGSGTATFRFIKGNCTVFLFL